MSSIRSAFHQLSRASITGVVENASKEAKGAPFSKSVSQPIDSLRTGFAFSTKAEVIFDIYRLLRYASLMHNEWLNYHHLYYFWVIAKQGSISKARKELKLAQPTLSGQLSTFEKALNKKLFERKKRRLFLTNAGRLVFSYAEQIFTLGREMQMTLKEHALKEPANISIGILPSIPKYTVNELLTPIMKKKHVFVSLREGTLDHLMKDLQDYKIDIILSDISVASRSDFQVFSNKIKDINLSLVGHPKFKSLKKTFPRSLDESPIILFTEHSQIRADIDHYFDLKKVKPSILGEIQDVALLRLFALKGVAIVPAPKEAVKDDLKAKRLVIIGELPSVTSALWAITTGKRHSNKLAQDLVRQYR